MDAGTGRGGGLREAVIAVGAIAGLALILIGLTGSDVDKQASQMGGAAFALALFSVIGATGMALVHWQPRAALFGLVTATLALMAGGATVVSTWENGFFLFGFGFQGSSGTVGAVTVLFALASSAACVLLATARPGEDPATRWVRRTGIGALAFFVAAVVLAILDDSIDVGARVYAIAGTVYAFATVVLLVLRLLPTREETLV